MTIITTPGPDCESLAAVADADTYHAYRGRAAWAALALDHKEQLLRQAYDHLSGKYAARWPDGETFGTIAGIVMKGARDACSLLAWYAIDAPIDAESTPQVLEQAVGPIKTTYAEAIDQGRTFPDVARLMAPYLVPINRYSIPLVRA